MVQYADQIIIILMLTGFVFGPPDDSASYPMQGVFVIETRSVERYH